MTPTFRHHDQTPPYVASPLYRQLLREWVDLNTLTASAVTVHQWARLEPTLTGYTRPADIVDAIDAADPARTDEMLLALLRLHQRGHQLAGRVLLQTMLPKLIQIARRASPTSSDDAWTEDRHHIAIAEFWDVMTGYPVDRRPTRVASNLALDTLHRLVGGRRHQHAIPIAPNQMRVLNGGRAHAATSDAVVGTISVDADLIQVLTWAVAHAVVTADEATLLAEAYLTDGPRSGFAATAARLGLSQAAVRQRCSRASRRITAAVRNELAPSERLTLGASR